MIAQPGQTVKKKLKKNTHSGCMTSLSTLDVIAPLDSPYIAKSVYPEDYKAEFCI